MGDRLLKKHLQARVPKQALQTPQSCEDQTLGAGRLGNPVLQKKRSGYLCPITKPAKSLEQVRRADPGWGYARV